MIDREKLEQSVRLLLEAIGEDGCREGLRETPQRVARMYEEVLAGYDQRPGDHLDRTFDCPETELVLERDIVFHSLCEHHLLPFFGHVHIAYIPGERVVGLSKLCRLVEVYAGRLQIQERLGQQIAEALYEELQAKGMLVMIEAEHTCMTMRGVKRFGTRTVTLAGRGWLQADGDRRREALALMKR